MLRLNIKEALQFYIEKSKTLMRPYDIDGAFNETTGVIASINDVSLMPELLDAVRLCCCEGFDDNGFHSLCSNLISVFTNLAIGNGEGIFEELEALKSEMSNNPKYTTFYSCVKNDYVKHQKELRRKHWTSKEIKLELSQVEL
jgi:hypothetical protein